ncbi:DUF885 domain-containing protein [Gallaecimonas kandeliae]|uniref:DUF885 domain-containing protein n=1 Tax=Gallaecimonas kandeliae TaxID=3029055 RepID=UPI0026496DF0|nr:DUF885 domain-containing protein [Gallaecimonas kandeliae]WKE66172.1 DUF885 domain-containing protein [Gallaecimonas kandeliae]
MSFTKSLPALALTALLAGCAQSPARPPVPKVLTTAQTHEKAQALFQAYFDAEVAASPMWQTELGMNSNKDKWDDISDHADNDKVARAKLMLDRLGQLDAGKLDDQDRLSLALLQQQLKDTLAGDKWRHYDYPVNQMYGWQSEPVAFLINSHNIENKEDALAYIRRLNRLPFLFKQLEAQLKERADEGIIAPAFVFQHVEDDIQNLLKGVPFEREGEDNVILADFKAKVAKVDGLNPFRLTSDVSLALRAKVGPAYRHLLGVVKELAAKADDRDGVWKLPDGDAFYDWRLKEITTTNLSAQQIHDLGLKQVARIQKEMEAIKDKVGFRGDLKAFFEHMRTDPRFYYPNDEAGRARYLKEATALIDDMKGRLPQLFGLMPKAEIDVKAVEAFREKSAGKAFYQGPAPDGSRPGRYYVNLYNMKDMPSYQMAALAYHEGIPGHHMQIALAQELKGIPMFRRYGDYTAYIEGWGLYAEEVPKEIGLYQDPYADFGRLAMELWRACRLVVDTGIHRQHWSRQQAIDYLLANTPNPKGDVVKAVERYIVMPGQATAYMVGKLKIMALRNKARQALGDKFDIRAFHDQVLMNGPLPLNVLEQRIDAWIAKQIH